LAAFACCSVAAMQPATCHRIHLGRGSRRRCSRRRWISSRSAGRRDSSAGAVIFIGDQHREIASLVKSIDESLGYISRASLRQYRRGNERRVWLLRCGCRQFVVWCLAASNRILAVGVALMGTARGCEPTAKSNANCVEYYPAFQRLASMESYSSDVQCVARSGSSARPPIRACRHSPR